MTWILTLYVMSSVGLGPTPIRQERFTSLEACVAASDAIQLADDQWVSCFAEKA